MRLIRMRPKSRAWSWSSRVLSKTQMGQIECVGTSVPAVDRVSDDFAMDKIRDPLTAKRSAADCHTT